jgi:hypothetical protein
LKKLEMDVSRLAATATAVWNLLSWNVHWQCGSDYIPECRANATSRIAELASEFAADVVVAVKLEVSQSQPTDLRRSLGVGWTQINGSCPGNETNGGDAMALLLKDGFRVVGSDGGCLGGHAGGIYRADSRAFAVALVKPPARMAVASCPTVCVIGLHSPHIDITLGAAKVANVCGAARVGCTIALGDWNAPFSRQPFCNFTVADRWSQLVGGTAATWAAPDQLTCCFPQSKYRGWDDHVVTNVPGARGNATALPYQMSRFSNDTEEHMPIAVTLELV